MTVAAELSRPRVSKKASMSSMDKLFHVSLVLLSAQGILNFIFRATPLVVWKQALLYILIAISFNIILARKSILSTSVYALAALLVLSSLANGISLANAAQHILYYVAWVPFYLFGLTYSRKALPSAITTTYSILLVYSCIGLYIQMYTPYLNFLIDDTMSFEIRERSVEAQRYYLYFVASTLVMPTLMGYYYFATMGSTSAPKRIRDVAALLLALVPTGSLSAAIIAAFGALMALFRRNSVSLRALFGTMILLSIVALAHSTNLIQSVDERVAAQFQRILSNDASSDSNQFRMLLWQTAINRIENFDVMEHLSGLGLGSTFSATSAFDAVVMHGESSFFQAYIEGGLPGLLLRLMPFIILFISGIKTRRVRPLLYCLALLVASAVAPIFGGFGLQCILGFICGYEKDRKEC